MLLLTVPGTEECGPDTDEDAQKQMWDNKKVLISQLKVCVQILLLYWTRKYWGVYFAAEWLIETQVLRCPRDQVSASYLHVCFICLSWCIIPALTYWYWKVAKWWFTNKKNVSPRKTLTTHSCSAPPLPSSPPRSEERRVGEEGRTRGAPDH